MRLAKQTLNQAKSTIHRHAEGLVKLQAAGPERAGTRAAFVFSSSGFVLGVGLSGTSLRRYCLCVGPTVVVIKVLVFQPTILYLRVEGMGKNACLTNYAQQSSYEILYHALSV